MNSQNFTEFAFPPICPNEMEEFVAALETDGSDQTFSVKENSKGYLTFKNLSIITGLGLSCFIVKAIYDYSQSTPGGDSEGQVSEVDADAVKSAEYMKQQLFEKIQNTKDNVQTQVSQKVADLASLASSSLEEAASKLGTSNDTTGLDDVKNSIETRIQNQIKPNLKSFESQKDDYMKIGAIKKSVRQMRGILDFYKRGLDSEFRSERDFGKIDPNMDSWGKYHISRCLKPFLLTVVEQVNCGGGSTKAVDDAKHKLEERIMWLNTVADSCLEEICRNIEEGEDENDSLFHSVNLYRKIRGFSGALDCAMKNLSWKGGKAQFFDNEITSEHEALCEAEDFASFVVPHGVKYTFHKDPNVRPEDPNVTKVPEEILCQEAIGAYKIIFTSLRNKSGENLSVSISDLLMEENKILEKSNLKHKSSYFTTYFVKNAVNTCESTFQCHEPHELNRDLKRLHNPFKLMERAEHYSNGKQ